MGFRFHRSVRLMPGVRLNMSKSGPSVSLGVAGARVNLGPRGVRTTVGIPGSGLSYVTQRGWNGGGGSSGAAAPQPPRPREPWWPDRPYAGMWSRFQALTIAEMMALMVGVCFITSLVVTVAVFVCTGGTILDLAKPGPATPPSAMNPAKPAGFAPTQAPLETPFGVSSLRDRERQAALVSPAPQASARPAHRHTKHAH